MQQSVRMPNIRRLCSATAISCVRPVDNRGSGTRPDNSCCQTPVTDHVDMVEVKSQLKLLLKTGDLRDAR
ncbi:hypothetical protein SLA2020_133710 [Shorea laevis]